METWPDVMNLIRPEPRSGDLETVWVAANPNEIYPKMFDHLMGRLQIPRLPDPPLADLFRRFKALQLHNRHRDIMACDDPRRLTPMDRAIRSELLEVLRLYFTELVHRSIGGRIGIHITKDLRYRL